MPIRLSCEGQTLCPNFSDTSLKDISLSNRGKHVLSAKYTVHGMQARRASWQHACSWVGFICSLTREGEKSEAEVSINLSVV